MKGAHMRQDGVYTKMYYRNLSSVWRWWVSTYRQLQIQKSEFSSKKDSFFSEKDFPIPQ